MDFICFHSSQIKSNEKMPLNFNVDDVRGEFHMK